MKNNENSDADTETQGSDPNPTSKSIPTISKPVSMSPTNEISEIPPFLERLDDSKQFNKRYLHSDTSSNEEEEKPDLFIGDDDISISACKINKLKKSPFLDKTKNTTCHLLQKHSANNLTIINKKL